MEKQVGRFVRFERVCLPVCILLATILACAYVYTPTNVQSVVNAHNGYYAIDGELVMVHPVRLWLNDHGLYPERLLPIVSVTICDDNFNDADLLTLCEEDSLRSIKIISTSISKKGISGLRRLPKLEFLLVGTTVIDGDCIQNIAKIRNLQYRHLSCNSLEKSELDKLINLNTIVIATNSLRDQDLGFLKSCRATTLCLQRTQLTDECLSTLRTMRHLKELSLDRTAVAPAALAEFLNERSHLFSFELDSRYLHDLYSLRVEEI